jgi:hypothetical protein
MRPCDLNCMLESLNMWVDKRGCKECYVTVVITTWFLQHVFKTKHTLFSLRVSTLSPPPPAR